MTEKFHLASFPKSGNTWINFIIANIFNLIKKKYDEIDFHNIHAINPALNKKNEIYLPPAFADLPNVYTTHSPYKNTFNNVILVTRNPWDVMYSYYHYLKGERQKKITLSDLIIDKKRGIRSLCDHNESFLRSNCNLLIITYEHMHLNPEIEGRKIADFLDLNITNETIKKAIRLSAFKNMRKLEIKKGRKFGTPGFIFTRSGKIGEGERAIKKNSELYSHILNEIKKSPFLYCLYG